MHVQLSLHCVSKKGHFVFAYILDICQPIFTIFSTHMYYRKFATGECITNPPCTVCRTALPCKILITTLVMFMAFCPRMRTRTCKLVLEDPRGRGLSSRTTTLGHRSLLPIWLEGAATQTFAPGGKNPRAATALKFVC